MTAVLVDSCVWSLALRGRSSREIGIANQLAEMVDLNEVRMIGPVRQEVLSGYSNKQNFEKLRQKLVHFPNEPIKNADYESAAEYSNLCRSKSVQGSHIDFLICAVALRKHFRVFSTDKDFDNYAKHLPLQLVR